VSDREPDSRREPLAASFEIDGDIEDSTFEDVDSTADKLVKATGLRGSSFRRIRHHPVGRGDETIDWVMIGAIATVVGVIAAIVIAIVS
jgi:hypothetical protein